MKGTAEVALNIEKEPAHVKAADDLAALAETIRQQHGAVMQAASDVLQHAIAAGDSLLTAKGKLPHGAWRRWLQQNCELPERTAQRYCQIAAARSLFESNPSRMADLTIAGCMRLLGNKKASIGKNGKRAHVSSLSALTWTNASPNERRLFLIAIGLPSLIEAMPFSWSEPLTRYAKVRPNELDVKVAKCLRLALAQGTNESEAANALRTLNNLITSHGRDLHEIVGLKFDRSQTIEKRARAKAA
jgi:hypothetical protein